MHTNQRPTLHGDVSQVGQRTLPSRFPSLDGWRALSILMVLGEHSIYTYDCPPRTSHRLDTIFDGSLGVRFFFVISGFLITYLLLKEHAETGALNIKRFYARRALRILPVYFVFLAVVGALQMFTPLHQPAITWIGNLTFTTNFLPLTWTTGHLWSLAVEEQFYLFWPILLCLAGLQNTRRILGLLCVPIIVAPICRAVSHAGVSPEWARPFFQPYSSLNQFDSLAVGCMAAVLLVRYYDRVPAIFNRFGSVICFTGCVFILIPQMLIKAFVAESFTATFAGSFQAFGFALLLLQSALFPRIYFPLNWRIVRQVGVLSYSIYIWQQLFCTDPANYGLPRVWFMSFHGWQWAVLVVALCSYYCLEKPLMALRARFRPSANGNASPSNTPKIAS